MNNLFSSVDFIQKATFMALRRQDNSVLIIHCKHARFR